jgi:hypothetical protein
MQVGVEPALIVPAERAAVGSENFRDDAAAAWNYVGRITRVSGGGVDAEVVLLADQSGKLAELAVYGPKARALITAAVSALG